MGNEKRASWFRRYWPWLAGVVVLVLAVGGLFVLWSPAPGDSAVQGTQRVSAPEGGSLDVDAEGFSVVTVDEAPGLSFALRVHNDAAYLARDTRVAVSPVDESGQRLTDSPMMLTVHEVPADSTMAVGTIWTDAELADNGLNGEIADIADVETAVDDTGEWWHDEGDLKKDRTMVLDGPVEYRDTYDELTNLTFTVKREGDFARVEFDAIAVFRDDSGDIVGGCRSDHVITGVKAVPRMLDCPIPESAERNSSQIFTDVTSTIEQ